MLEVEEDGAGLKKAKRQELVEYKKLRKIR
jgi:hypothetical protein